MLDGTGWPWGWKPSAMVVMVVMVVVVKGGEGRTDGSWLG